MPKRLPGLERQNVYSPRNRFKTKFPSPDKPEPEPFDHGVFAERFLRIREWLMDLRSRLSELNADDREMVKNVLEETIQALEDSRKTIL